MMLLFPVSRRNADRDCRWAWRGHAGARHRNPRDSSKPLAYIVLETNFCALHPAISCLDAFWTLAGSAQMAQPWQASGNLYESGN